MMCGQLIETRYAPEEGSEEMDTWLMDVGSIGFIHDALAWHQIRNPHQTPAISLHLYSMMPFGEFV